MKKFHAKIIVKMKPDALDQSVIIEQQIEYLMPIEDLSCETGDVYYLNFAAENQCEALNLVEKISTEILANEEIETYEIRKLEEFNSASSLQKSKSGIPVREHKP